MGTHDPPFSPGISVLSTDWGYEYVDFRVLEGEMLELVGETAPPTYARD